MSINANLGNAKKEKFSMCQLTSMKTHRCLNLFLLGSNTDSRNTYCKYIYLREIYDSKFKFT